MIEHDHVRIALASVKGPQDMFADLFAERTVIGGYEIAKGICKDIQFQAHQGIGLRCAHPHGSRHVHTTDLSEEGLEALTHALRHDDTPGNALPPPSHTVPFPEEMDTAQELERITREAALEASAADSSDVDIAVATRFVRQRVLIGCTDGIMREDTREYASIRIDATVRQGRKVRTSQRTIGAQRVQDLCNGNAHRSLARQTIQAALERLDAINGPSGEFPVILGPGGPATLWHEACGHPLEADLALHPRSAYYGLLGTRVAAPCVTLLDHPAALSDAPVYAYDDEGELAQPTVLIEEGILRNYLFDKRTARVCGQASNGHARRLSYAYPPLPRMSTTYIAAGDSHPDEIIAETPRAILVHSISGGDTDMGSGRFNLQVNEAHLVEHGRVTAPLKGVMLSGRGPDVLRAIDRVGNDMAFMSHCYVCNKLTQFPLLVSVGQPTLRVSTLSVWGG